MLLLAQGHGLQVAPRGGVTTWLGGSEVKSDLSPEGGLDLRYTVRWRVMRDVQVGLYTGVSAGYSHSTLRADLYNQYDRTDLYDLHIQYTTTASVEEKHRQLGVELPILFALQAHGFALNVGPKLLWMAMDSYDQTISDAHIDAYYTEIGVHVTDTRATGLLPTPAHRTAQGTLPKVNMLLSAEIGYEWQVGNWYSKKKEQYVGIQLYANYGLWGLNSSKDAFLSVTPSAGDNQLPKIAIGSISSANTPLNYLSAGLRLYYTIQTVDYPGHGWHQTKRSLR